MTRTQRLLTLLQILKESRCPITAANLAEKLQISVRSIYRDIESLRNQGAEIDGEAGIGYQLKGGLLLPPLIFDDNELEALMLGLRWIESHADEELKMSALRAMNKINAVIPAKSQTLLNNVTLYVFNSQFLNIDDNVARELRLSLRIEKKTKIHYRDEQGRESERTIWPIAVGYMRDVQMLAAWCELRQNFRHFRLDRIVSLHILEQSFPYPKDYLLQRWRKEVLQNTTDKSCQ